MKASWSKVAALVKRELLELRSARLLATLALFAGLQLVVMMGAKQHGRMEDTFLIFTMGGLATVVACFDLLARERDHHTLDLLLTQGMPRGSLWVAKWLAALLLSLVVAGAFSLATVAGTLLGGQPVVWGDILAELGTTAWVLAAYASLALACSVIFRRGKGALIAAALGWVLLRPATVTLLILDPLQRALGWSKEQVWRATALLPEYAFRLVLDPARGAPPDVTIPPALPYLALAGFVLVFSLLAWGVFVGQDEPVA